MEQNIKTNTKPIPSIDDYLNPLSFQNIKEIQPKIDVIINQNKAKLEEKKSLAFLIDGHTFSDESLKDLFKVEKSYEVLDTDEKFNVIVDSIGFLHKFQNEEELKEIKSVNQLDVSLLKKLINALNDKGVLMLVMDYHYIKQIYNSLKDLVVNEYKSQISFFLKQYIIEKLPLVGILYMQKMNTPADFDKIKMLSYEIYDDLTITKPISFLFRDLAKSVTYMNEMYQYQGYLSELRPDTSLKINIKENFWSDNVEYTFTVVDSNDPELQAKKNCVAVIVSKSYSKDFIYLTDEGNQALCQQTKSARVILIRPAPFNNDSVLEIKEKVSHYILLFKFKECISSAIPIMLMADTKSETHEVYKDNHVIIRDVVENDNKETFRQLVFLDNPSEIQSEIKLTLTSKTKVKNSEPGAYIPLPTIEKYKSKNFLSCLDENFICSFYIKTLLCSTFFLNLDSFPENPVNILILGAGIGTINYFFDKILKSKVNITAIELSKQMTELGHKYFGFNNFNANNFNWVFGDAKEYVDKCAKEKNNENKYDIIIIDINNLNTVEGISPPPLFFDDSFLRNISSLLKNSGLYVINLMARSYHNYNRALKSLDEVFPLIFFVENNEDLNKIHFCFKEKLTNDEYIGNYKKNFVKLNDPNYADIRLIEKDHKKILARVSDIGDYKKNLSDNK